MAGMDKVAAPPPHVAMGDTGPTHSTENCLELLGL